MAGLFYFGPMIPREQFEFSKKSNMISIISSIVLGGGAFYYLFEVTKKRNIADYGGLEILALVVSGFAVFAFILSVFRMMDPRPALEINDEGLEIRTNGMRKIFVPWSNIKSSEIGRNVGVKMVSINLHDNDEFIRSSSKIAQYAIKENLKNGLAPVMIPSNQVAATADELVEKINQAIIKKNEA